MVPVGAAGVRRYRRHRLVDCASCDRAVRPAHFCRARPADDGLCGISGLFDRSLSADASGVRRRKLAGVGRFPLPIQTSRILLYAGYFFVGVGVGAVRSRGRACSRRTASSQDAGRSGSPLRWCFMSRSSVWSTSITIGWRISIRRRWSWKTVTASPLRCSAPRWRSRCRRFSCAFARSRWSLLDALQPSAYGIYLLHYIFIIWLQYAVYDYSLPGLRQVRDRVYRHAVDELGAHRDVAEDSGGGADDLKASHNSSLQRASSPIGNWTGSLSFRNLSRMPVSSLSLMER